MKFVCIFLIVFATAASVPAGDTAAKVSFNNQIEPILSEYCYPCHGPDSATRKPKKRPLRLDREQFAFEPREDGKPVIIKGDPAKSEVVRRINAKDDDIMPPASTHKTLKPEQITALERWIAQGAQYEKHWALLPPMRTTPPADGAGWARNPIDQFVAAKLKKKGLKPNPEEHKARLYRRLSFDLTGLPPSPEDLERFLNDKSPGAYDQAVERMLASDQCAENFARHWLDAVRYADTQGIHHDHMRSIWPYRDWVIAAFKNNLRFDEFTIEQLAGDMLKDPTLEQKIASGYNRLLPTTGEGGAIPEEYAAIYAKDRVETTSAVWLGLTTGCATCHDHKFDPITTKNFYSLTSFFRNNTVPALDSSVSGNTAPLVFVPAKGEREHWDELEKAISEKKKAIEERKRQAQPDFVKWISERESTLRSAPETASAEVSSESADGPVFRFLLSGTNGPFQGVAQSERIQWAGEQENHLGPFGPAPRVSKGTAIETASINSSDTNSTADADDKETKPSNPTIRRKGKVTYGAFIYLEDKPSGAVFSRMDEAKEFRGWDLFLSEGRPTVHIIDQWPEKTLKITAKATLKPGRWHHVAAVFDGTRKGAEAIELYVDGTKAEVEVNNNKLGSTIATRAPFRFGGRSNGTSVGSTLSNGKVFLQDLRFYDRSLSSVEIARWVAEGLVREYVHTGAEERTAAQTNELYELYVTGFDAVVQKLQGELAQMNEEEAAMRSRGATTLVMEEKKDSEPVANILLRGNYANKGEKVTAATPEALPPMAPDLPRNRLGLARWILAAENPLTARVTVNRLWADLFGIGIVETTEDFGVKGARPSNQELLDWLAVELKESGWDYRHMARLMVTSAAYRQSEAVSAEKLDKDPSNKLCSRGPHLRLDAEEIRDQALAASGLLVQKVGGPPVKPYQPEGVWEAVAMKDSNTRVYQQDIGEALYRRSVYTFWKRVAPPPSMEILNAPSREVFCTRRERTDTPLQAFVTMNDPQFVEAARQLAAHTIEAAKAFDTRLDRITEALLARKFDSEERATVHSLEEKALKQYQTDPEAAKKLITVGESKPDEKLAPAELAAWTLVASQVMNLDESLTK